MQLVGEISEACTSSGWTTSHTSRVALLAALATYDQEALSRVEDMVDLKHDSSLKMVKVGVRLLKEAYTERMAIAAEQRVQDAAASLAHICDELIQVMWFNVHEAAMTWREEDVGAAATLLSLVDVVVKAIPHSTNVYGDIQQIFQVRWCRPSSDMHASLATCGHIPHTPDHVYSLAPGVSGVFITLFVSEDGILT